MYVGHVVLYLEATSKYVALRLPSLSVCLRPQQVHSTKVLLCCEIRYLSITRMVSPL
jgi:hypothetical protein